MKSLLKNCNILLLLCMVQFGFAQQKTVTGSVSDAKGSPLYGVNISVIGTKIQAQTDFDGKFSVSASEGSKLLFKFLGSKTVSVVVTTAASYKVILEDENQVLDEVVVVGYGTQKRKEVTSSVSKIKGGDILNLVTPSFESQLAGRASGVQVTTQNGILGAPPKVRIRGTASISSGTDPLYIVDGMQLYSGDVGGYAASSGLGDINPNDIESYDVLKDGAATAIYGSRGANGVILITTKKGKKGSMKVNFTSQLGIAAPVNRFDLLKTNDFILIANEKRTNRGQAPWAIGNTIETDWQGAVLRSGAMQSDHSLSFSGGTDKTKYFMSFGYANQQGVAVSNDMVRYSFRTNLEHQVNNWLTVGGGINLNKTDYNGLNTGRNSLSGNIFNAMRQLPNVSIFDPTNPTGYNINLATGNVGQGTNTDPVGDNISNVAYTLEKNKLRSSIQRAMLNTFLSANITKNLNYRFQASVDNPITKGFLYYDPIHGDGRGTNGRIQNDNTTLLRYNIQHILNYNKSFKDTHNFSATGVVEIQKERNEVFFGSGTNLLNQFYNQHLVTGSYGTQESGGSVGQRGITSYIGRASYNYKQRYFLQGSVRRDGISQLAPDTRWNNFTGYSGGWNIANESFMKSISNTVNDFKLRASYSEVGNVEIGNFPYLGLTSASQYGTLNGIAFTQFGNNSLRWETSKKTDYGIDLAMFDNRVRVTADYFKNDVDGLILQVPQAPSLGIPSNIISKNIGKMLNDGYEFNADVAIFKNTKFKWDVNANVTFQKNKVVSLPGGLDIIGGSSGEITVQQNIIIREGESANSIFGFEYAGVNAANGNPMYFKADGSIVQANYASNGYNLYDPTNPAIIGAATALAAADRKILGNTLPTYFGGFNSKMSFQGFDFSFLLRFSGGNKIFNATRRDLLNQNLNNNSTEILGRWQSAANPGDGITPKLWASANPIVNQANNATTRFVEDGSFISFDNITFGYSLPRMLLEKIKIDNVRFFVAAQNLFIITKYKGLNPEMETFGVDLNGTPRARVLSMGINVNL